MVDQLTTDQLEVLLASYWYLFLDRMTQNNTTMYIIYHSVWIAKHYCDHDDYAALMQTCVDNNIFDTTQQAIFMTQQPLVGATQQTAAGTNL